MPEISICIPAYEMGGLGAHFLTQSLESIARQTYQDIEIIVSDHGRQGTEVRDVCERFHVRYMRNESNYGNSSANLNNALKWANGKYVKLLFQDDLLACDESLGEMKAAIDRSGSGWLACGCIHSDEKLIRRWGEHRPRIPEGASLALGRNSIGAPSVVMFRRNHIRFDEQLIWLMDCEFYYRMLGYFGKPCLLQEPLVIIRVWKGSVTNTLATDARRNWERAYVREQLDSKRVAERLALPPPPR